MTESDPGGPISESRPKSLAALMSAAGGALWQPEELAAIFRHQMSAPVLMDLGGYDHLAATRLAILAEAQGLLLKNFSELFRHPAPPLELLKLTKDFAKSNLNHPESALPKEIAMGLYYVSIAAALARLGERISELKDDDLRRGLLWGKNQTWLDEEMKGLLNRALEKLPPLAGERKTGP